ncbi:hypothetical protein PENTCL1PPCAC_2750, partial [Pristionchus entomophagus]
MLEKYKDEAIRLITESGFELAVSDHIEFKNIGAGCVSSILRVRLKDSSSIVVKLTEKDDLSIRSELHNRELDFYQWLNEKSEEDASEEDFKCPKFYGGYDCTDNMGLILMEDLSHRISNDMNFLTGFNIASILKVVRELASIQSQYLSSSDYLHNKCSSTFGAPMLSHDLPGVGMRFDFSSFETNCLPKIDQIKGISSDMRSKLREWVKPLALFKIQSAMPREVLGVSTTPVHCDLWPENLLFERHRDEIDLLSIIDWQCFQIGNPLLDVASVLGLGMTSEDRKEYTNDVVKFYLEEMEKRKPRFKKSFYMTLEKAHRLLSLALRYPCVQLMTAIVTLSDDEVKEHTEEYETMATRLRYLME